MRLVIEDGDPATLGEIARARGMTQITRDADIGREALYKALRPGAAPRFDAISRVCKALREKLVAQVREPEPESEQEQDSPGAAH